LLVLCVPQTKGTAPTPRGLRKHVLLRLAFIVF
jgi:hypothetical protein